MKKFISLLLCAVLVIGAVSFAFADDAKGGLLILPAGAPAEGTNLLDKYEDVVVDSWYYDALYYCEEYGILDPTTDNTMSPDGTIDRKEIVSMLYRAEGEPAFMNDNVFSDVAAGDAYEKAIVWANGQGIVLGFNGLFRPNDPITRQEFATVIYRYAQTKGEGFTGDWMFLLPFEDTAEIADWANEAAHWCYMKNIIKGSNGKFMPLRLTSRAEAACMVQRVAAPDYEAPAHEDPIPVIAGGWNVNEEFGEAEIPAEAKAAFDKAMEGFDGVGYTPVAYLGSQLVAGTNYAFLCKAATVTATPVTSLKVVVVYQALDGEASIKDIKDVDVASYKDAEKYQIPADGLTGAWNFTEAAGGALGERAQAAFDKATEGLLGVGYEALAELGSQVVAGTNHAILCKATSVTATPNTDLAVMVINYDLSGEAIITNIAEFAF